LGLTSTACFLDGFKMDSWQLNKFGSVVLYYSINNGDRVLLKRPFDK
jgi:hypothetical protein